MEKNQRDITEEDCIKWKKNKSINPHTNYKINKNKPIYKKFEKACLEVKTPNISNKEEKIENNDEIKIKINKKEYFLTKEICQEWLNDKYKNPYTKYKINEKSPIYKVLEKSCKQLNITKPIIKKDIIKEAIEKINKEEIKTKNPKHHLKRKPTEEECKRWKENKLINPLTKTKSKIIENGSIYKELEKECIGIKTPKKTSIKKDNEKIIKEDEIKEENKIDKNKLISKLKEKEENKKIRIKEIENKDLYYPELNDKDFNKKLLSLKEISIHKIDKYKDINSIKDFENKANELCKGFDKSSFQYLIAHYLSYRTPYKSLLLYYSVGVGKTCTAITIAEGLLINHNINEEPIVWVILPGAIEAGFKKQIFDTMKIIDYTTLANQCTGDTYIKLGQITNQLNQKEVDKRIRKIIKSRYQFFTYEGFANYIENNYKNKIVNDKVIIVDEAHNIRSSGTDDDENKRVYNSLMSISKTGANNKLILLTATPMYNEPMDIYNLFLLLLTNDKREYLYDNTKIFDNNNKLNEKAREFISLMSSNYVSYLRGKNPFNFALKLSPKLSGYKILDKIIENTENGNPIDENDKKWLSYIEDGIITSELGQKQKEYLISKNLILSEEGNKNNFAALQPMNIVYDKTIGREGFNNIFIKTSDKEQLIVKYNQKYKNILIPDEKNIGLYSGKFLKLSQIIKKSKGIILIYSRYIWSGIIPIAIMLEHLGFDRLGTDNILDDKSIKEKINYNGIKNPKYCILSSSDPEIMGNTTIEGLMNIINSSSNTYGEEVKVVLMTPVAGEGLNFLNIREIHLMESWYHFNRIDQIIGRGIRNCSHKNLPIEERNVTIFMYCAINNYERETADVHAYRISSRKLNQSYIVEEIIRNNAIDCSLFKNINYFPKEMFKLGNIDIITSQGTKIKYNLGDDEKFKPECKINLEDIKQNSLGFREETYKHLGLNIKMKIKNIILDFIHNNERFITYNYLKEIFKDIDEKILMYAINNSIYPNIIIDNILILPHQDGLHIIDVVEDKPLKIIISKSIKEEIELEEEEDKDFYKKLEKINTSNYDEAIISLYLSLDEKMFKIIINNIFKLSPLNKIDSFIENCFLKEGILISKNEIPNLPSDFKYIGFINIYNEEFEPLIYNKDGINHKNLNPKQIEILKSNRKQIIKPDDLTNETLPWGLMIPVYEDKEKKNKLNVFKLLTPGVIYGKKTGIVCTSLQKKEHSNFFKNLSLKDTKNTKESYCFKIASKLYSLNRLSLLPEYKPK